MAFVVDCSVVARWFLPDEATRYSESVLDRLTQEAAYVPSLWASEFANVMLKLERQRQLKSGLAAGIFGRAEILGLVIDRQTPAPARLHDLARQFNLSAYDATYLELALRLGVPLACIDGGLKQAARTVGLLLTV
jgi:predicted nucleic acid-binding protein